ncbi:MAG: YdeI/OmpD-associated family protein [Luteolibacter sp.]
MTAKNSPSRFSAKLHRAAKPGTESPWAFLAIPKTASDTLPRRGRTSVEGAINGHPFCATLEPDGQLSHWLKVDKALMEAAGIHFGDSVELEISPVKQEPEPEIPANLEAALAENPEARQVWEDTTPLARLDWIHWMVSAKQAKTRTKRIADACDMLAKGKNRVCCFDPSGYYSKAFHLPEAAD